MKCAMSSGKSTTTGRLLFDLGGIDERNLEKLKKEAEAYGKGSFAFAFYMDRQKEERERGVTITCQTKEFFTKSYHYTIIDAPGHRDFIKNMISGAAQADVGLLLVPADGNFHTSIQKGDHKAGEVQGQTRQHARLINLLGVKQIVVGANKMDSDVAGPYKKERFEEVRDEVRNCLTRVGLKKDQVQKNIAVLPLSGWNGDNLTEKSTNMSWWEGTKITRSDDKEVEVNTLYDVLEHFVMPPERKTNANMRVPISGLYKIKGVGDVVAGRVEQGTVEKNKDVVFLPTHTTGTPCAGRVFSIEMHHKQVEQGTPGDNIGMNIKGLDKSNPPHAGDVMVYKKDDTLKPVENFTAQIQTLDIPSEVKCGYSPIGFVRCGRSACKLVEIKYKVGKETGGKKLEQPGSLKSNEVAEAVFKPVHPLMVDSHKSCEGLSRIAFLDGNAAVMLGKVTEGTLMDNHVDNFFVSCACTNQYCGCDVCTIDRSRPQAGIGLTKRHSRAHCVVVADCMMSLRHALSFVLRPSSRRACVYPNLLGLSSFYPSSFCSIRKRDCTLPSGSVRESLPENNSFKLFSFPKGEAAVRAGPKPSTKSCERNVGGEVEGRAANEGLACDWNENPRGRRHQRDGRRQRAHL